MGRKSISEGQKEEETQFLAYWTGQALAEFEAGNFALAESALGKVLEVRPNHVEANALAGQIATARVEASIQNQIRQIESLIEKTSWDKAVETSIGLARRHPKHPDVLSIKHQAAEGKARQLADLARARRLFEKAKLRNLGRFDQQALDWLAESALLSPDDEEIASLLKKMSAYTRTIRVPEDIPTAAQAIELSRVNDRIVLGKGNWKGPLVIKQALKLEGSGPTETIVSCRAERGNVITVMAAGVQISGCGIRHENLSAATQERFSGITVSGGSCELLNCHITRSNGHGVAIFEGATATIRRCQLTGNAWNGAAAQGNGSQILVEDSTLSGNYQNGIESWQNATAEIRRCQIVKNSRNGIHIDQGQQLITCLDNRLSGNREYGLCLSSAGAGNVTKNHLNGNLLGGLLVRKSAEAVKVESNESKKNQGSDLILQSGLNRDNYQSNRLSPKQSNALLHGVKFDD